MAWTDAAREAAARARKLKPRTILFLQWAKAKRSDRMAQKALKKHFTQALQSKTRKQVRNIIIENVRSYNATRRLNLRK